MSASTLSAPTLQRSDNTFPEVTVSVISYNGRNVLRLCLESILAQEYPNFRIQLINNASTDGTAEWVKQHYPDVEVLNYPENRGPNPARNYAIQNATSPLVLLVDDDAVLGENCIAELIDAYRQYPHAAVWSPRIMYHDQPELIQFEGTSIHYLAEAVILNGDRHIDDGIQDITPIQVAGGVCYLVSQWAALQVGLFDEDYFFGKTDGEFTFRLTQAGYEIYSVPGALCYHRVKKRGLSKVYYQIRNRWFLILQTYAWKTLFLIAPSLLVYEFFLVLFLTLKGAIGEYFLAIADVFKNLPALFQKRRTVQRLRRLPDKKILHHGSINMRKDLMGNPLIAIAKGSLDTFFNLYWKLVYPIL